MRIDCKVRVVNRNPGIRSGHAYLKSTIALGKETGTDNDYFLLHLQNVARGRLKTSRFTKYNLKCNPTKVYTKCIDEGRITLSFTEPKQDLFVQGAPEELHRFLLVFNTCLSGQTGALKPSPISVAAKESYNKFVSNSSDDAAT